MRHRTTRAALAAVAAAFVPLAALGQAAKPQYGGELNIATGKVTSNGGLEKKNDGSSGSAPAPSFQTGRR